MSVVIKEFPPVGHYGEVEFALDERRRFTWTPASLTREELLQILDEQIAKGEAELYVTRALRERVAKEGG